MPRLIQDKYSRTNPDTYARTHCDNHPPHPGHAAQHWAAMTQDRSLAKVRGSMVFVAQRIGLASTRCEELTREIQKVRNRLLSQSGYIKPETALSMEERILRLEQVLHTERVTLWKDVASLAQPAKDAAVEAVRKGWLHELARTLGDVRGSTHGGEQTDSRN